MSKWQKWRRLSRQEKRLFLAAFLLSGWYRFSILHRSFAALSKGMGKPGEETDTALKQPETVRLVARAVQCAARHTPWQSNCFVQALTARKLLARRNIPCTLYMGACCDARGKAVAHAWLRSGTYWVTGGDGAEYAVTSVYATYAKE